MSSVEYEVGDRVVWDANRLTEWAASSRSGDVPAREYGPIVATVFRTPPADLDTDPRYVITIGDEYCLTCYHEGAV